MAVVFKDDFNSYLVGTFPSGYYPITFGALVDTRGELGTKAMLHNSGGGYGKGPNQGLPLEAGVSIFTSFFVPAGGGLTNSLLVIGDRGFGQSDASGIPMVSLGLEQDSTISVWAAGTFVGTEPVPILKNEWNRIRWDVEVGAAIVAGNNIITVDVSRVYLNYQLVLDPPQAKTIIRLDSLPDASAAFNFFEFYSGGSQFGWTDNIAVAGFSDSDPFQSTDPVARVSQLVLENLILPPSPKGRVSQLVVEPVTLPNERARISQLVVELVTANGIVGSQGFVVYEA